MFGYSFLPISTQYLPTFNGSKEELILYIDKIYYKEPSIANTVSLILTIDRSKISILSWIP